MQKAPQSARQQWILIGVLVIVIVGGAASGFLLVHRKGPAARQVAQFTTEDDSRLRGLLDEGKYESVVAETGRLGSEVGKHATVLRYRALGQLMLDRPGEAVASANEALTAGASGPEAAVVNAAKALAALKDSGQQAGVAKEAAQQAMVQAGRDPQAGLLANAAFAAVLREELERQTRRQGEEETRSNDGQRKTRRQGEEKTRSNDRVQGSGFGVQKNDHNHDNSGNPQISQLTQIQQRQGTTKNAKGNNNGSDSHRLTQMDADDSHSNNHNNKGPAEAGTPNEDTAQAEARTPNSNTARIRQVLEPIYATSPVAPRQAWVAGIWRRGLAMYGECGVIAGQSGDRFTEAQVLAVLARCCPADVWACELKIPERAVRAARQVQGMAGKVDEHARAGLWTVVSVLYEAVGEVRYADAAYGRAMAAWQRVLTTTEDWRGEKTQIADGDQVRVVGAEYFAYRHCLERIAVFRANQWGARIAAGQVTREAALGACDHPLFAALVRLRAEKQGECGRILREAKVEREYWPVVADVIERWPAGAEAAWAKTRAQAVRAAAREPMVAVEPVVAVASDMRPVAVGVSNRQLAVAGAQGAPVAEAPGKAAGAAQSAPVQPYGGMTDIATGVGGGRSLAKRAMSEAEELRAEAAPQPVPDFGWGQAARGPQMGAGQGAGAAGEGDLLGQVGLEDVAPASQPDGPAQGRAQALAKEINTQLAAGNVEKALDAYFELQGMAANDSRTSELTRSLMEMFGQSIEGLGELQDLLDELEGKPKKRVQQQQQRQLNRQDAKVAKKQQRRQQRQQQPQINPARPLAATKR